MMVVILFKFNLDKNCKSHKLSKDVHKKIKSSDQNILVCVSKTVDSVLLFFQDFPDDRQR